MMLFIRAEGSRVVDVPGHGVFSLAVGDSLQLTGSDECLAAMQAVVGGVICEEPPAQPEPPPRVKTPADPQFAHLSDEAFASLFSDMKDEHERRFDSEWRDEGTGVAYEGADRDDYE